jgi:Ca2+-binding EF-hand superfamily protein
MHTPLPTLFTTLSIALLLSTSVASADPRHGGGEGRFMRYFDINKDGTVTYQEFLDASKKRFERIDTDKNAAVSESEFSSYTKSRGKEWRKSKFDSIDTNKDGKISKDEFLKHSQERAQQMFDRLDKNGDGKLTDDEMGPRNKHRGRFAKRIFSRMDTNHDGQISLEESQAAWGKWFQRMDTNGDKVITEDEVQKARSRWQGPRND